MSPRHANSEQPQLDLFRARSGTFAPRDAEDLMAYPFFSLSKSKRQIAHDYQRRLSIFACYFP